MTPSDRAQAAARIVDDRLCKELLDEIESSAVESMLIAPDDHTRRECRDTVLTIRSLRTSLRNLIVAQAEATKPRQGYA